MKSHPALQRSDGVRTQILNPQGVEATLFATPEVRIEPPAVDQLLSFISISSTLSEIQEAEKEGRIDPFLGDSDAHLRRVVITPDFHKGSGIPIGTVAETKDFIVPQAIGNDICCGMRLLATDITEGELTPLLDHLPSALRHVFFRGGRNIPMSPRQRKALLQHGLWGLWETSRDNADQGLWKLYDPTQQENDLHRVHFQGVLPAKEVFAFDDFIKGSGAHNGRDTQIGSVGGGNHFVEIQTVRDTFSGTAHEWSLTPNTITVMVHSGSVGLGHTVGGFFTDQVRSIFPKIDRTPHTFWPLPTRGPHAELASRYLDAMRNAANFAFGNRLFLGLMAVRVLSDLLGRRVETKLIYDAPHNLIWEEQEGIYLHRKGACPAQGPSPDTQGPFRYTGQPVIVPGSMGASSYVLAGKGCEPALSSACHGAGRALSRGESRRLPTESISKLRVVTPIDPSEIRLRRDILAEYEGRVKEEAPHAYKDITPIIETIETAGIADRVARLWPLLTVKG